MAGFRIASFIIGRSAAGGSIEGDIEAIQLGVTKVVQLALEAGSSVAWIVTNTLDDITQPATTSALGHRAANNLRAGRTVQAGSGVSVRDASQKTIGRGVKGAILAIYPTPETLFELDSLMVENSVIVIPWLASDVREWVNTWGPDNLLEPESITQPLTIADEEVLARVEGIISNLTGVSHPSDKKLVTETFKRLKQQGRRIVPSEIRSYVIRETG